MESTLEPHEFCLALPEMSPDRFADLVADIAKNGLIHLIVLFEGKILDGRHRYRACLAAGVAPRLTPFLGTIEEAYNLVVAENLRRRDLTPEQRLDVATKLIAILREKAKEAAKAGNARGAQKTNEAQGRSLASLPKTDSEPPEPAANVVVPFEPKHTHVEVAKAAGVSPRTAQDFLTIKERGTPEDLRAVVNKEVSASGRKTSVSAKAREVREREKPKADTDIATEAPKRRTKEEEKAQKHVDHFTMSVDRVSVASKHVSELEIPRLRPDLARELMKLLDDAARHLAVARKRMRSALSSAYPTSTEKETAA